MPGPKGTHSSLDTFDTTPAKPPTGTVSGFLIPPPKQINPGDAKRGPAAPGSRGGAGINKDSFFE